MLCASVRGDLTCHRYILRGLVPQKSKGFFNVIFVVCRLVFAKVQRFFTKLSSIECVSISLKFRESFVKFTFTKSGGSYAKLPSMDCGLISAKFRGYFCKIYISNCF